MRSPAVLMPVPSSCRLVQRITREQTPHRPFLDRRGDGDEQAQGGSRPQPVWFADF